MTEDQHGPADAEQARPLPAALPPRPDPPEGPPLVDPLTFGDPLPPDGSPAAGDPARDAPLLPAVSAPGLALSGVRAMTARAAGRRPAPPGADPAAVTARRHGAVTRSPSGTPPPLVRDPQADGGPAGDRDSRPGGRPHRQLRLPASLLAACAVLIAAAVVAIGVRGTSGHPGGAGSGAGPPGASAALQAAATARSRAAAWVAREISPGAVIACDARMCAAVQARGVPAADLLVLGAAAGDPMGAGVVIATPGLRAQLGTRLARVYAPVALARFGSGAAQIDIRVVAPGGSAAYLAALRRDQAARRSAGTELLASHRIEASAEARAELTGGRVDARLLLLLPALAAVHPVHVLAFGGAGPRADPLLPLCSVQLAGWAAPAGLSQAGYASWLRSYLSQQRPPYRPQAHTSRARGGIVITVEFPQPGPVGLLHGG